jgi:hypothetical protein
MALNPATSQATKRDRFTERMTSFSQRTASLK